MRRLQPILTNSLHHIYSKSIYQFVIFSCPEEYERMMQLIQYYQYDQHTTKFSGYLKLNNVKHNGFYSMLSKVPNALG